MNWTMAWWMEEGREKVVSKGPGLGASAAFEARPSGERGLRWCGSR
jgi:hypothetical protein